jgi:hypothetical protein
MRGEVMARIELKENSSWSQQLVRSGTSIVLTISPSTLLYLGGDPDAKVLPRVIVKADCSKRHGPFIGFGLDKVADKAAFQTAVDESAAQLKKKSD